MKEQITIFYNKNKKQTNDYLVKRVITQDGECYTIDSYFMINGKLKNYHSSLKLSYNMLCKYLLQCRKEDFFNRVEYQNMMEGI